MEKTREKPLTHTNVYFVPFADTVSILRYRVKSDRVPADWQRERKSSNADAPRQTRSRLWCLPGGSRPAGEEALQFYLHSIINTHTNVSQGLLVKIMQLTCHAGT